MTKIILHVILLNTGSHTREGRSSAENPEMQARPELARQPKVEISTEMEISAPTSLRRRSGAARPSSDADPVAEMAQKDKPEIVPTVALPARQEVHLETTEINTNPPFHTKDKRTKLKMEVTTMS